MQVKKIIGIGWNYAKHAAELGNNVPSKPIFFLKPSSSLLSRGAIELPAESNNVHFELELGDLIGKRGKNISLNNALKHVSHYCLALDMTARDLQMKAKKDGSPWSLSKGFDTFCPVGALIPFDHIKNPQELGLKLYLNNKLQQDGSTKDMVFKIPQLIAYLSSVMTLEEGDLILTGTPDGVGRVEADQILRGELWDTAKHQILSKMEFATSTSASRIDDANKD